jgi:arabinogalactan endo-1,4-beta-galactosidase
MRTGLLGRAGALGAAVVLCVVASTWAASLPYENDYAFGLDVSFVKQRVDQGTTYKDANEVKTPLQIFKDHGYNWGRVHLCNEPVQRLPQTLQYVTASGQAIKRQGMKFLLDLMFSNSWANPMTQPSRYFREIPPPFPETPEGQRQWLEAVHEIVLDTPNGLGRGVFWWEPMMAGRGYFDRDGQVLPIIHAFEKVTRPIRRPDGQTRLQ